MTESYIPTICTFPRIVEPRIEQYEAVLILILGFAAFSVALALLYNFIRRRVFGDSHNLDQSFDAGGHVSTSLTAVTVAVQMLWPADLLQSATVTAKYGISGGFWYSISIIFSIMLFPLLSLQFKTRAPGAKTYLQLIKARFGARTHILYCVFALATNVIITATLIVAGAALFQVSPSIIKDISNEMVVILMAVMFGSYSFVGGLGSTFYVSYFNAVFTLCVLSYFVVKIFYMPDDQLPFGNFEDIYEHVSSLYAVASAEKTLTLYLTGPADNEDRSYLTFWSTGSMVWAGQGTFICLGLVFCDQASWQSKIAAKPLQGVLGFFFATLIWFAIPSTIGTSAGLAYLSYSKSMSSTISSISNDSSMIIANSSLGGFRNSSNIVLTRMALSDADLDAGLVTPFIADVALGKEGGVILLIMFTMLLMSTGASEVMGVASIIVYDIYQSYLCPYRKNHKPGMCLLCGKEEVGELTEEISDEDMVNMCCCPSVADCKDCVVDLEKQHQKQKGDTVTFTFYTCPFHGQYRTYQDTLIEKKNWVILWVAICIVPLGLAVIQSGVDLNWIFMNGAIVIVQAFPGIICTIVWVKVTSEALVIGALFGMSVGLCASFSRASQLEGGLANFLQNTADGYAVLAGSASCLFGSLLATIVISLATHRIKTPEDEAREWQKLRDIDNPLRPLAKIVTIAGVSVMIAVFVFIIPGFMAALHTMTSSELQSWLMTLHIWCFVTAVIVLFLTPAEEVRSILRNLRRKAGGERRRGVRGRVSKGGSSRSQEEVAALPRDCKDCDVDEDNVIDDDGQSRTRLTAEHSSCSNGLGVFQVENV
ncbi:uncharacterized protein LOC101856160 [Aplysia californica]|uniref:Uncharacterized protein LOC101856160 n=1 Tax=Aplysia californica TaxID=6500 RepID=A0ABM1W578_APLCA|nr:uncharacterized protein LOC101856160 [Aplysia californica]